MFLVPNPSCLNGSAEAGPFSASEADRGHAEDVRAHLAPEPAVASASGEPDLGGMHPELAETRETIAEAESHALESRAGHVRER